MRRATPVAIVTGASRGAGKGIAIALGRHGCTVYVTGRTIAESDAGLPGTIGETAEQVTAAGGCGIAVRCDHSDDAQVAALFSRIKKEQGRIDILVNNACAIIDELTAPGHFWQKPLALSKMFDVGIRSGYVASWHAAHLMTRDRHGLIVFTSASGAVHYVYGAAYGVHKASMDKMAHDMAVDLREYEVAVVSIWMGALLTERLKALIASDLDKYGYLQGQTETPEYTGHVIWALYNDAVLMELSGQTLIGAELGERYGLLDAQGRKPRSYRQTHQVLPHRQYPNIIR